MDPVTRLIVTGQIVIIIVSARTEETRTVRTRKMKKGHVYYNSARKTQYLKIRKGKLKKLMQFSLQEEKSGLTSHQRL